MELKKKMTISFLHQLQEITINMESLVIKIGSQQEVVQLPELKDSTTRKNFWRFRKDLQVPRLVIHFLVLLKLYASQQ